MHESPRWWASILAPTTSTPHTSTTLAKKKEPSSRFAARRTLFHVWYHARSQAISAGQKSRTVADRTLPALIACDRAWYHTWNSVLLAAESRRWFFFLARVVAFTTHATQSLQSGIMHACNAHVLASTAHAPHTTGMNYACTTYNWHELRMHRTNSPQSCFGLVNEATKDNKKLAKRSQAGNR